MLINDQHMYLWEAYCTCINAVVRGTILAQQNRGGYISIGLEGDVGSLVRSRDGVDFAGRMKRRGARKTPGFKSVYCTRYCIVSPRVIDTEVG